MGALVRAAGALGVRTVHQVDAKAQLLVRSLPAAGGSSSNEDVAEESGDEAEWLDAAASGQITEEDSAAAQPSGRSAELQGLSGESDVLPVPRFVAAEGAFHDTPETTAWVARTAYA